MASCSGKNIESKLLKSKKPNFFKIILVDSINQHKLRIPRKFARTYGDYLSSAVTLKAPTGAKWKVEIVKTDGDIWFQNGWPEFADYYSLAFGSFVVFEYEQGPDFDFSVAIFDKSATQIDYPFNFKHDRNVADEAEVDVSEPVEDLPDVLTVDCLMDMSIKQIGALLVDLNNKVHKIYAVVFPKSQITPSSSGPRKQKKLAAESVEDLPDVLTLERLKGMSFEQTFTLLVDLSNKVQKLNAAVFPKSPITPSSSRARKQKKLAAESVKDLPDVLTVDRLMGMSLEKIGALLVDLNNKVQKLNAVLFSNSPITPSSFRPRKQKKLAAEPVEDFPDVLPLERLMGMSVKQIFTLLVDLNNKMVDLNNKIVDLKHELQKLNAAVFPPKPTTGIVSDSKSKKKHDSVDSVESSMEEDSDID